MSKRFIDTEIFEDEWFMSLSVEAKLLYIYLFTKCDHAGLIKLNLRLCEFATGIRTVENCLIELDKRVIRIEGENNLYFLPKFFKRQYPNYPKKAFRAATSAEELLRKYGLWDENKGKVRLTQVFPDQEEKPAAEKPAAEDPPDPEDPPPPPPEEKINHILEAVDTWNFFANHYGLSTVLKLTDARKAHVKERLKEKEFNLEQILRKVEKSEFLLGKQGKWKCSFDFIFSSKNNYIKILEGNYDGRNKQIDYQDELNELLIDIEEDSTLKSRSE